MSAVRRCLRLGFAGTPEFAIPAFAALLRSRHSVAAVFTQPDRPAGRGQSLKPSAVKQLAGAERLPVYQPVTFKVPEPIQVLRDLALDALVVVAYGLILPAAVLEAPKLGSYNIHASLLPRWRGAAPIQRAILAGDETTGVSIMRMDAGLDTGPVLLTRAIRIAAVDSTGLLHDKLAALGGELIVEALDRLAEGTATESAQAPDGVTYARKIDKSEALLDWREEPVAVVRRIHAFNPWPVAYTHWNGAPLRIHDAEVTAAVAPATGAAAEEPAATGPGSVVRASSVGIDVACGRGVVRLLSLQLPGRKVLPASEFIKAQDLSSARFIGP